MIPYTSIFGKHFLSPRARAQLALLSCSPTGRSTEKDTPIARAVSGSLCVCELSYVYYCFADLYNSERVYKLGVAVW